MNKLEQLKSMTTVVADTGDVGAISQFTPQDATTNPSLILKASNDPQYQALIEEAISFGKLKAKTHEEQLLWATRKVAVNFGCEILKLIPGRVSTEVNAALSFDTEATIREANTLIELYAKAGVDKKRVLIKIASTFEGIAAAEILEKEGINCNLTLLFSFTQAVRCADAGVTLISPFVGRIYDWYKLHEQKDFKPNEDPGVRSVKMIFDYYKTHKYQTIVMGASFRSIGQIEALAGCDYLTISPSLLAQLEQDSGELQQALDAKHPTEQLNKVELGEPAFRFALNQDAMATEKLAEGIRLFCRDLNQLETQLKGWS